MTSATRMLASLAFGTILLNSACGGGGSAAAPPLGPMPPSPRQAAIHEVQGSGADSALAGTEVALSGNIVTALTADGFFMQAPAAAGDGNAATSEGIFVFLSGLPAVSVGDEVTVTGTVGEIFGQTEIGGGPRITVTASGLTLPEPVIFDASRPSPMPASVPDMERFEGMRVRFSGITAGPSDSFGEAPVVAGNVRPFREPGIAFPGLPGLPVWDGNPEVFVLDPDGAGLDARALSADRMFAGQQLDVTGVLAYAFGDYRALPTEIQLVGSASPGRVLADRGPEELALATQNAELLRAGEPDAAGYADRLGRLAAHIHLNLRDPHALALQEIGSLAVAQDLADRLLTDWGVPYAAHLVEGNATGSIDNGFLIRSDALTVDDVYQFGAGRTLSTDGSQLFDRLPLVLEATWAAAAYSFTAINVHQRSLIGIEGSDQDRVRIKRLEQAQALAEFQQSLQASDPSRPIIVLGDFNAFEFTDGYVDVMGQVTGRLDPLGDEAATSDVVSPDFENLTFRVPEQDRYSFVFEGNAQVLDHILVSASTAAKVSFVGFARGNADAPEAFSALPGSLFRVSDHDGAGVYIDTRP